MNNHARSRQNRQRLESKSQVRPKFYFNGHKPNKIPAVDVGVLTTEGIVIPEPAEWKSPVTTSKKFRRRIRTRFDLSILDSFSSLKTILKKAS